jgi:hypothetical protein
LFLLLRLHLLHHLLLDMRVLILHYHHYFLVVDLLAEYFLFLHLLEDLLHLLLLIHQDLLDLRVQQYLFLQLLM